MKLKYSLPVILFLSFCINLNAERLTPLSNNYFIVINDNVNLRKEPNIQGSVIRQLKIASEVKILKRFGKKEKVGNYYGEWVFVDTKIRTKDLPETIKGWVFDYFLSDRSDFKIYNTFKNCTLENMVGDSLISYKFFKDGRYKRRDIDKDGKSVYFNGILFKNQNVIVAHDEASKQKNSAAPVDMVFYLNEKGILCSTEYDIDGNQICADCK